MLNVPPVKQFIHLFLRPDYKWQWTHLNRIEYIEKNNLVYPDIKPDEVDIMIKFADKPYSIEAKALISELESVGCMIGGHGRTSKVPILLQLEHSYRGCHQAGIETHCPACTDECEWCGTKLHKEQ